MLSDKELRSALESGKFQLKYAFLPDPDGRFHQLPRPVGPYEEEDARRKFEDSLIRGSPPDTGSTHIPDASWSSTGQAAIPAL
jgi:hypothetical protein